jgi:diadenylate cyclase
MPLNVSETPLKELLDVVLVAALAYLVLLWLRHNRAQLALLGTSILGAGYLLAHVAGLVLLAWVLQALVAVAVVLLVVVFQADLWRGLERLALLLLGRRRQDASAGARQAVVRAAAELAAARRGALIVLPGREPLDRHVEGGVPLSGTLSEPLLLSLFDPNSPGHDGAVLLDGARVARFAVHLPLSADFAQLGSRGTRHAAALGLAERCDALTVVVSEERGCISVARAGRLVEVGAPTELARLLDSFPDPPPERTRAGRLLRRNWRPALLAAAISLVLWTAFVPGSQVVATIVHVPVAVEDLPPGWLLEKVEPAEVAVTVSGPRRRLLFARAADFELEVDAIFVQLGRRSFEVDPGDVRHPKGLDILAVQPGRIALTLRPTSAAAAPAGPS